MHEKFKLFIAEWFKMTFRSLKKCGSMMLLDLSFDHMVRKEARSDGVSVSSTIYVLYDGKIKKICQKILIIVTSCY